ncbi:NAD-dependent epimerase/dehydratase family protein [Acidothermaceae bacterium B102]|nr:NAD-dependent epimerase/dehydratase family protein [Acidothermaceae bacterium B102]
MDIFLTGATGYIGSSLLRQLTEAGHSVSGLARSEESAAKVTAGGGTPVRGEIGDTALLAAAAAAADAVVHVASPGDATSADLDDGVVTAFLGALRGTGKPYLHTSGVWVHGDSDDLTEGSPFAPPAITAWRLPLDARVRAAAPEGVHSVVIAPGIVYGHGGGLVGLVLGGPHSDDAEPALLFPGSGNQHWTTIHVDDVAALYVAALTRAPAGSYYLAVNGDNPSVRELATAASTVIGLGGRVAPEPVEQTRSRLGLLEEALALDQRASGQQARVDLGWAPQRPTLLTELTSGSYT